MVRLAALLLAVGPVAGCVLDDCAFETSTAETVGGLFLADARAVGDTLTLAFVNADDPALEVDVPGPVLEAVGTSPDGVLEVLYDAESTVFGSDGLAQPLVTTAVGDTVFVYVAGTIDPAVFVCSPSPSRFEVEVREVLAPAGVRAVRVARLEAADLLPRTAATLRTADAARLARLPISI